MQKKYSQETTTKSYKKFRRTVITHLFFIVKLGLFNLGSYFYILGENKKKKSILRQIN